jgi:hypothetical protein
VKVFAKEFSWAYSTPPMDENSPLPFFSLGEGSGVRAIFKEGLLYGGNEAYIHP